MGSPIFEVGWLGWIFLIPLFVALGGLAKTPSRYYVFSLVFEALRWCILIAWLRHVSYGAWFVAVIVVTGCHLPFYICFRRYLLSFRSGVQVVDVRGIIWLVALAALWATTEWVRTNPYLLPGAGLSVTQFDYPKILKICSYIGGFGLSFLIILNNLFLHRLVTSRLRLFLKIALSGAIVAMITFIVTFGEEESYDGDRLEFAVNVIQPYQPAYRSWNRERMYEAVRVVRDLTLRESSADLVLWPEGTLPWSISPGSPMQQEVSSWISQANLPLLFGNETHRDGEYYNAVMYMDESGKLARSYYAKHYIVPFGEFIPLRRYFPWVKTVVPIETDYQRGELGALIEVQAGENLLTVGPLICYEDCFPRAAREAVESGADFLYVATYNVWYREEWGAKLHAYHSNIRAAEFGIPIIRCGNAGWSGWIDERGRTVEVLEEGDRGIFFRGAKVMNVSIPKDRNPTFYGRNYHFVNLAWPTLAMVGFIALRTRSKKQ